MKLRSIVSSVLLTGMLLATSVAGASPSSDALAKEEAVAAPLVQAIVTGANDFSAFSRAIDKNAVKLDDFKKVRKEVKDLEKAKSIMFAAFSRNNGADAVTYIVPVTNNDAYAFTVVFNTQSGLVSGVAVNKLAITAR